MRKTNPNGQFKTFIDNVILVHLIFEAYDRRKTTGEVLMSFIEYQLNMVFKRTFCSWMNIKRSLLR